MAANNKESRRGPSTARRRAAVEHYFVIEAYTPETMPMARLAEYLGHLSEVLGEENDVHLIGIQSGSTAPVVLIEREAVPKVHARVSAVRSGDAQSSAIEAYRKINALLRADDASAYLRKGRSGAKVLVFPGKKDAQPEFPSVKQPGSLQGLLIRVGGIGDQIPVIMESEGETLAGCHTNKHTAKEIAKYLFEPVRVSGAGTWTRDAEGRWALKQFRIDSFEPLDGTTLGEALRSIRAIGVDWKGSYDDVMRMRSDSIN